MMKNQFLLLLFLCFPLFLIGQNLENRVISEVDSTNINSIILKQTFLVNVSIDSVWNAYTTKKGWENWATALAEIDFKINGLIRTNYNKKGKIGDDNTITLHIVNYIPKRMLTLQAEINEHFPQFMKDDAKDLYNIILFEEVNASKTKVISYGIGYKNNEKYKSLLKFFIKGNTTSYMNLINYLETGKPSIKY